MLWHAALLSPPYSTLTYDTPEYLPDRLWQAGQRVFVPLGRTLRSAVLLGAAPNSETAFEIKAIFWPVELQPLLPPASLDLVRDVAARHCLDLGRVLASVIPAELRSPGLTIEAAVSGGPRSMTIHALYRQGQAAAGDVAELWWQGQVSIRETSRTKSSPVFAVNTEPPWPLRPQARRQSQLLDFLWEHGAQQQKTLRDALGSWVDATLKSLEKKNLISRMQQAGGETEALPEPEALEAYKLTQEQNRAYSDLKQDLDGGRFAIRLLHGVTGSGKTLVYLLLIRDCLRQGRSAMLLVPEVALALKAYAELRRFLQPYTLFLYHGYQASAKRSQTFAAVSRHQGPVAVVGTRSAVFLPRQDWGVIVIDEEHDASFKQEERFQYQAKEVAFSLARSNQALLLLSSATPDVKTLHSVRQGQAECLRLEKRVSRRPLPEIELVDLGDGQPQEGPFHGRVQEALQACLERNEQAIILLNRRGYAPLVYCTSCRQVVTCQHCRVGLTYHKKRERLLCHYCGLSKPFPSPCPQCGGHQFLPIREGTEQVEEYLATRLDRETGVLRLDRDNTRRKGSLEAILEDFAAGRAQVLVGTQMCSKGHHFPAVTLVVVVDGDIGLNLPDYRATERTFQLLVQVAGRAGRGQQPGRVLIQTRNPSHYCWQYIKNNDYNGFFEQEIARRQSLGYPPFVKLGLLRMSFPVESSQGPEIVRHLKETLSRQAGKGSLRILGPAPAPMSQLRGRLRYNCLIKASSWQDIRALYNAAHSELPRSASFRLSLDLDPVHML